MSAFAPKAYQRQVLDSIQAYCDACHHYPSAAAAFTATTAQLWGQGNPYYPLQGFPAAMPYFCLRIPTGGGKTWLAAKSVALLNTHLLHSEHSVVLWLVPSKAIRAQTLNALRQLRHPYHLALREAGQLTILDLEQAKSVTRATLDTSTTIIVTTRQAFQVEDEECRKVYQNNGALMSHFDQLAPSQQANLLPDEDGTYPYSLANVLRLRRPLIIVDEAHNSRTPLAFEMLARLNPSAILELTATPDLERNPSNVLHSVSAAELQAEHMIKMPVMLHTEPNWQHCLAAAITCRDALQQRAAASPSYLRPIMLIQAAPRRAGIETLDVAKVREELITNHNIPEAAIVVATGEEKGLETINARYAQGISDAACPVKFVITQKALAEGWDCPFAYVLVSMASIASATAVEQLLGRILRQPYASAQADNELNQSYAFVVSNSFAETANALRDGLVNVAGFVRREVAELVRTAKSMQDQLDLARKARSVTITLPETPNLSSIPPAVRNKVRWEEIDKTLTIVAGLSAAEAVTLSRSVSTPSTQEALLTAVSSYNAGAFTPAERGVVFHIPQLALRIGEQLHLFNDPQLLDYLQDLPLDYAAPNAEDLAQLAAGLRVAESGEIYIDAHGGIGVSYSEALQHDLELAYPPENWNETRLAVWLCRNLPQPTLTHDNKSAFVQGWLSKLLATEGFNLARANLQKFIIRNRLEQHIRALQQQAAQRAYQATLFGSGRAERVTTTDTYTFQFRPDNYNPNRDYDRRFGSLDFRHHFYPRIGDFDSKEEFLCACELDKLAASGRIEFWVRNPVRRDSGSFFLPKANGRFYPDFVCKLPATQQDKCLVVEYKGADRWDAAKDDRDIGNLWAELSGGRCRFVMVKNKNWEDITQQLD